MNQKRNLIWNIVLNIIVFIGIVLLTNALIAEKYSGTSRYFVLLGSLTALVSLLCKAVGIFIYNKEFSEERCAHIPPLSGFILLYYGYQYIKSRTKMINFENYSYYSRIYDDYVTIYNIGPCYIQRIGHSFYSGAPEDVKEIHRKLKLFHDSKYKKKSEDKFREWDGAVDDQAKRIKTIEKIIQ